jgi:pyruvate/2-oxoglutarate dehydrogenase complex dihydrolipoamide acyltransferase (E2) component
VQDEYVLAKVLEGAGREVKVGEPVALSVEDEAAYQAFVAADKAGAFAAPPAPSPPASSRPAMARPAAPAPASAPPSPVAAPPPPPSDAASELGAFLLMPSARHLLESRGLALRGVQGTGKDGRVTKGDVLNAIATGNVVPKAAATKAAPPAHAPAVSARPAAPPAAAAPTPARAPVGADHG